MCPDIFISSPIQSARRQGSNGPPGTRIEGPPLSDQRSVQVDDAQVVPFWVRQFTRTTLEAHDDWRRDEEMPVHEYVGACLRAASTTIVSTAVLALSLFLPYVIFPWIGADSAALPA